MSLLYYWVWYSSHRIDIGASKPIQKPEKYCHSITLDSGLSLAEYDSLCDSGKLHSNGTAPQLTQPGPEAYEIKFVGIPQGQSTLLRWVTNSAPSFLRAGQLKLL